MFGPMRIVRNEPRNMSNPVLSNWGVRNKKKKKQTYKQKLGISFI